MSKKTFIAKNHNSGLLHAYRYTGSHFTRRCGTGGHKSHIQTGSGVTKVSAPWFLRQSDACQKCKSTFEIDVTKETMRTEELQDIARDLGK